MEIYEIKASEKIKSKLRACGGEANIPQLKKGYYCTLKFHGENSFTSNKLSYQILDFSIFDIVVDFLKEQGGRATKGIGRGRGDKVGYGNCTCDTVLYAIATKYYGYEDGDSTFDPLFVIAAVLQWAGIARNTRGELILNF